MKKWLAFFICVIIAVQPVFTVKAEETPVYLDSQSQDIYVTVGAFTNNVFVYTSPNIEFRSEDENIVQTNIMKVTTIGEYSYYTVDFWGVNAGNAVVRSYDPDTDTYLDLFVVHSQLEVIAQEATVGESFSFSFQSLSNNEIAAIGYSESVTHDYNYYTYSYENHGRTIYLYTVNLTLYTPGSYLGYVMDSNYNTIASLELNVTGPDYEEIVLEVGENTSVSIPFNVGSYDWANPPEYWTSTDWNVAEGYTTGMSFENGDGYLNGNIYARKAGSADITVTIRETGEVLAKYRITVNSQAAEEIHKCNGEAGTYKVNVPADVSGDMVSFGFSQYVNYWLDRKETNINSGTGTSITYEMRFWTLGDYSLYFFDDSKGEVIKEIRLSVSDHEWQGTPVIDREPSCTIAGSQSDYCTLCGTLKAEEIPATGHIWNTEPTIDMDATCIETGQQSVHCSVCNEIMEDSVQKIQAKGHVWNEGVIAKEATCISNGEKLYTCTICGEKRTEEIEISDHAWNSELTIDKKATCTKEGSQSLHCSVCDKIKENSVKKIPAKGHKIVTDKAVKATCTKEGKTEGKHCTVCKSILKKQSKIAAKGHKYGAWKTTKKATAVATGEQQRVCSVCKKIEKKQLVKLKPTIKLSMTTILLKEKQTTSAFKVTGLAAGDKVKSYASSNTKIAIVDSKGKITAKKQGTSKITVTLASGKKATAIVKVQKGIVRTTKLTLNSSKISLKKGKSYILKATIAPLTSTEKVTYKSSNTKIATVSSAGKIIAKNKGTVKITAISGKKKVTCTVIVK